MRIRKDKPGSVSVLKKYFKSDDTHAMEVAYDYYVGKVMPSLPFPKPEQLQDAVGEGHVDELANRAVCQRTS